MFPETKDLTPETCLPRPVAAGLLYRLTIAFPSWAGAILAVYSIFLCRCSALKIRLR